MVVKDGPCQRAPLEDDPSRWTFCPDCLTAYDEYDAPLNF